MTEPESTPVFRRFPWIQLAFCLACLSMAAWTWMRYSYCHDATVSTVLQAHVAAVDLRYLGVRGLVREPEHDDPLGIFDDIAPADVHFFRIVDAADEGRWIYGSGRGEALDTSLSTPQALRGRYWRNPSTEDELVGLPGLRIAASRFTGASVAGLVVGAMGCFIFGLYLRAWLRERKALASQPGQDMIA